MGMAELGALGSGQDTMTADQDDRDVWTVANGRLRDADGNLLVSFRDISTLVMINRRTGAIVLEARRASSCGPTRAAHPVQRKPAAVR